MIPFDEHKTRGNDPMIAAIAAIFWCPIQEEEIEEKAEEPPEDEAPKGAWISPVAGCFLIFTSKIGEDSYFTSPGSENPKFTFKTI